MFSIFLLPHWPTLVACVNWGASMLSGHHHSTLVLPIWMWHIMCSPQHVKMRVSQNHIYVCIPSLMVFITEKLWKNYSLCGHLQYNIYGYGQLYSLLPDITGLQIFKHDCWVQDQPAIIRTSLNAHTYRTHHRLRNWLDIFGIIVLSSCSMAWARAAVAWWEVPALCTASWRRAWLPWRARRTACCAPQVCVYLCVFICLVVFISLCACIGFCFLSVSHNLIVSLLFKLQVGAGIFEKQGHLLHSRLYIYMFSTTADIYMFSCTHTHWSASV
jgi:hypothetical protein